MERKTKSQTIKVSTNYIKRMFNFTVKQKNTKERIGSNL